MADIISTILTVLLIIVSILMTIIILLQSNRSAGGMFGSGAQTAFGAGSADALTKITGGFAAAFLVICFSLAAIKSSTRTTQAATDELGKAAPITAPATGVPGAAAPNAVAPAASATAPAKVVNPTAAPAAPQNAKPVVAAPATPAAGAAKPK